MGAVDNGDSTSSSSLGLVLKSPRGPPRGEASVSRKLVLWLVLVEVPPMGGEGTREDDC